MRLSYPITFPFSCGIHTLVLAAITVVLTHCVHAQTIRSVPSGATYNPGRRINSVYDDINPVLSADGNTLLFARKHSPANKGGRRDPEDVYVTEKIDGSWTTAANAGSVLNTTSADNICALTPDNKRLYFFIRRNGNTGYFGYRERTASGWSEMKLSGLEITNRSDYLESCIAFDEQAILFTANTKENVSSNHDVNERDIYAAVRKPDGTWSRPVNLGTRVNTPGDEYSPFLAADGRTLYFATNGRDGFGGVDLFVTRRIGDGWTEWTTPVNLGPEINSPDFDGYLSLPVRGNQALYVTRHRTIGGTDIIATTLPQHLAPSQVLLVSGTIRDNETNAEVRAAITIKRGHESRQFTAAEYATALEPGEVIQLTVQANGYFTKVETISVPGSDVGLIKDISLTSIASGKVFSGPIFFDAGRATLKPEVLPVLDSLINVLQMNPQIKLAIHGHTDNRGTIRKLRELSRERAKEVKAYFVARGVGHQRIRHKGAGPTQPIALNDSEVNRRRNRRVEFHFVN